MGTAACHPAKADHFLRNARAPTTARPTPQLSISDSPGVPAFAPFLPPGRAALLPASGQSLGAAASN